MLEALIQFALWTTALATAAAFGALLWPLTGVEDQAEVATRA